jgi:hypothetical protein
VIVKKNHAARISCVLPVMVIGVSLFACDLSEVEIPQGDPMVVVQAVMRPDRDPQFVVVEQTFTGQVDYQSNVDAVVPLEGTPKTPIENALVSVANLDLSSDSCGSSVVFTERSPLGSVSPGVYWAPSACPSMRAGDRVELTVLTPDSQTVSGVARIPGMTGASLWYKGDSLEFGTDSMTTFNRDRDTIAVRVQAVAGRLLQVDVLRSGDLDMHIGEDLVPGSKIFADTTAVTLPGDLVDVFARGDGSDVFRPGRTYSLSVALSDTNYYDFARSANNEYTGHGFINRLTGGVGVFGSLVAMSTPLKVVSNLDDEREGVYRLEGQMQGVDIDVTLSVFLYRSEEDAEFSAFLDGDWIQLIHANEGVNTWVPWRADSRAVDGTFQGNNLEAVTIQLAPIGADTRNMRLVLKGVRSATGPFRVTVGDSLGTRVLGIGTVTATQQR